MGAFHPNNLNLVAVEISEVVKLMVVPVALGVPMLFVKLSPLASVRNAKLVGALPPSVAV